MNYYLGIDIGTSTAKFVVIDDNASVINCCEQEYQYSQPKPGWKEIWPEVWVRAVKKGLKELLAGVEREYIKAIGISGQMHTTVFLDDLDNCIRPAIMWNDIRTKDYFPTLKESLTQDDTASIVKIISTGSPAANLLWLKNHEKDNYRKMRRFLIGSDYLVHYFTGKYSTDYCQASTSSLFDTKERKWSETMKNLLGLTTDMYPQIGGSQEIVGKLREELRQEFQLSAEVKVITGTGDNSATAFATGSLQYGYPVLSIGTSGVLVLPQNLISTGAKGKEILFSLDGNDITGLAQGVIQSAGGSYNWYVKKILDIDNFDYLSQNLDIADAGNKQLLFYPHMNGDKTIYADPTLRGAFLGLAINDSKEDMAIAVMEGISFAVKQLIQEMKVPLNKMEQLMVTGGGAKSKVWMQILADVLNLTIVQLEGNEGASYGAALLAKNALAIEDGENAKAMREVSFRNCFNPRDDVAELYVHKYKMYLRIHDAVKMVYQ
jgi:xylulokinase